MSPGLGPQKQTLDIDPIDPLDPKEAVPEGSGQNWPALVGEMARRRPLWGNGQGTLARTRDPFFLARALHQAGLPAPAVCADPRRLPPGRRWLVKPGYNRPLAWTSS